MPLKESDFTRVYTGWGKVAHLLDPNLSPNDSYSPALCGFRHDRTAYWFGTGTQSERDYAARMRTCSRCKAAIPNRNQTMGTRETANQVADDVTD